MVHHSQTPANTDANCFYIHIIECSFIRICNNFKHVMNEMIKKINKMKRNHYTFTVLYCTYEEIIDYKKEI